jgi:hypothetical protein
MVDRESKPAAALKDELDWAASILLGEDSRQRIAFDEPVVAAGEDARFCNWDVTVCCAPEDDGVVRSAIMHVADRWDLA